MSARRREPLPKAAPFSDAADYFEAQLRRLRALLESAIAFEGGRDDEAARLQAEAARIGTEIAGRATQSEAAGIVLGAEQLRRRFALDDSDFDLLLHAAAASIDGSFAKLHTKLSGAAFHPWLDVGLATQLHHRGVGARLRARARFEASAPLTRHQLIVLDRGRPEARENLLACEIKLPPRVARLLLGSEPAGDAPAYRRLVAPTIELAEVVLSSESRAELDQLLAAQPELDRRLSDWGFARSADLRALTLLISGPPGTGKTTLACGLARHLGKKLLIVESTRFVELVRGGERELEELRLEAQLEGAVVLIEDAEVLLPRGNPRVGSLARALGLFEGLVVLTTSAPERIDPVVERQVLWRTKLEIPPPPLREKLWRRLVGARVPLASGVDLAALGKRYELGGGQIERAVVHAVSKAVARGSSPTLKMADLDAAAQAQLKGELSAFADRTEEASLSLAQLVLPKDEKEQIEEIIAAGKNRSRVLYGWGFSEKLATGKGLVVLLSGDPGTGKTLGAEVIAAELKLPLYRINPAKVVSKYVGETEKNLNEILVQARATHSILFFDEADALFSARISKVETANDRFVNLETNFLLQQLERYEGIVILATNLETSIDQAFRRRIAYHVTIPFPKPADRQQIWRTLLPARAPVGKIDFVRLGKSYELSGGHIKNAILRAAYAAAQREVAIDHTLLAEAAEAECAAAGKLFHSS